MIWMVSLSDSVMLLCGLYRKRNIYIVFIPNITMIKQIRKKMARRKEFIGLAEANRNRIILNSSYDIKKRLVNVILGGIMVVVGLVTAPLPTGSIFLVALGMFVYSCPFSIGELCKSVYRNMRDRWLLW